ncbi:AraC family transcriptional regulator [bacterium]|nr:MAG: AraC family transcriptional regulator [bacterium]
MARPPATQIVSAEFARPSDGPSYVGEAMELPLSGKAAWSSNGGTGRGHPARTNPYTLEAALPPGLVRIHIVGLLARFSDPAHEAVGTPGASLQIFDGLTLVFRQDLLNGRHYGDPRSEAVERRLNGDGTSLETVGDVEVDEETYRVDLLTIDVPVGTTGRTFRLKDLGSPASFSIFDLFFEVEAAHGCPFHRAGGGVPLGEVATALKLGDRPKFARALSQLEGAIETSADIEEAKGQALTFLATVITATLEMGGPRRMHRSLLEAAREIDSFSQASEIAVATRIRAEDVAGEIFRQSDGPSAYLVNRALAIVDRNYAKDLTDATIATQLGLSTSHFRYLFKQSTGQPFHKYLVALRLEKARQMLVEQELAVGAVAKAVGFTGLSHFSRAFTQRFQVSPTAIRRNSVQS